MQRHIYRFVFLLLLFSGSIVFMVQHLEEITFHTESLTEMDEAVFPTVTIVSRDQSMNPLFGYGTNMEINALRESLTPIDGEQSFYVDIEEYNTRVKRLLFEVEDGQSDVTLDSGSISAMEEYDGHRRAKVRIRAELTPEKEYFVRLTVVTATGKKIRYFTRIKYVPEDHFSENMAFVTDFQKRIISKRNTEELQTYLEPDGSMDDHSLAYVNIHSSLDLVSFGQLGIETETDPEPVIVENTANTTGVSFRYLVAAKTPAGREEYFVNEFYRVQWTRNAMYLLAYERRMEAVYDPEHTSLAKSELKFGIADYESDRNEKGQLVTSGQNTRLCFVRERELWYYNIAENRTVRVFSFRTPGSLDSRELNDQHDVQILRMDDAGNIDFCVYGYMNRGVYEGRVAIVLYRFFAEENRIQEQVYIPLDFSYQILKEDLNRLSYVTDDSVYYFTIYDTLYAYNIITKRLSVVTEDITEDTSLIFPGGSRIVWQSSSNCTEARQLHILDLETGEKQTMDAPKGCVFRLLGGIDDNMIYGVIVHGETWKTPDGTLKTPMGKIVIADRDGNIRKEYAKPGVYTFDISVASNVITLSRMKKEADGTWTAAEDDHILNHTVQTTYMIDLTERVTEKMLTEWYVTLPYEIELETLPAREETKMTIIHDETILRLGIAEEPPARYYVVRYGNVSGTYTEAQFAISDAYSCMGYVVDEQNRIIWERGATARSASVADSVIRTAVSGGYDKDAINLSGTNFTNVLYYISKNRPVKAVMGDQMVYLIAYDEYSVTVADENGEHAARKQRDTVEKQCAESGNIFIGFLPY